MTNFYNTEISKRISVGLICGFFGVMLGGNLVDGARRKQVSKDLIQNFPKTEMTVERTLQENGKSITRQFVVPATFVPDSLLNKALPR